MQNSLGGPRAGSEHQTVTLSGGDPRTPMHPVSRRDQNGPSPPREDLAKVRHGYGSHQSRLLQPVTEVLSPRL
jgi:hypothetical protein